MLTSKQRAKLRGIASTGETILQVGKGAWRKRSSNRWTTR